ncbi:MAG: methyltransferase family protein [Solirubrobacterales bacterium]
MEPFPYTHHLAKVVFYGLIVAFVALELLTRVRSRLSAGGAPAERLSFFVVIASVGTGLVAALLAASYTTSAAISVARLPVFLAGAVLTAAGIALRQWAIAVLGRSFTVEVRVRADQQVVESGPYRVLAHPSYTGMIMSLAGIGLMLGNWVSLAALALIPTAGLLFRIQAEERVLLGSLGEPYRRFLATRARLVPGIW